MYQKPQYASKQLRDDTKVQDVELVGLYVKLGQERQVEERMQLGTARPALPPPIASAEQSPLPRGGRVEVGRPKRSLGVSAHGGKNRKAGWRCSS
jgi:hypothetical protein